MSSEEYGFLQAVLKAGGLDINDYKIETLHRRVSSCLRALRAGSVRDARRLVERNPTMTKAAIGALVIGVTSFFRDPSVFAFLSQRVLPELASRASAAHIWSAGCSDGAELYSVAMLLAEQGLLGRCHLMGTDCRIDAIHRAADGAYDAQAFRSVPVELAGRYFAREGGYWRIASALRAAVKWRGANVLTINEPGGWDMILCRNMSIYLRAAASNRLWQMLHASLRPGGYLVLGKAERPMGGGGFALVGPCVYQRDRSRP